MTTTTLGITLVAAGVAVGTAVGILICVLEPNYGIVVRATPQDIDDHHWDKVKAVLSRPPVIHEADTRDKLYRIREYKQDGTVNETGSLADAQLLEERQTVINGLPKGFVGHVFQIGVGAMQRTQRIPSAGVLTPHAHYQQNILESKEMVKEVNDALNGP